MPVITFLIAFMHGEWHQLDTHFKYVILKYVMLFTFKMHKVKAQCDIATQWISTLFRISEVADSNIDSRTG